MSIKQLNIINKYLKFVMIYLYNFSINHYQYGMHIIQILPCEMNVSKYCNRLALCKTRYNCNSDSLVGLVAIT